MRRPLDPAFSTEAGSTAVKNGRAKGVALVGLLLAGLAGTGTVFAANVGINGGSAISYSQGTQVIAPCDPDGIDVELDFGWYTFHNVWVLNGNAQKLTGVHRDCFSSYDAGGGTARLLTVTFYEGTAPQLRIAGQMLYGVNAQDNSKYMHPTDNEVIFLGDWMYPTSYSNVPADSPTTAVAVSSTPTSRNGGSECPNLTGYMPNPSSANQTVAGLCGSFSTSSTNPYGNSNGMISWYNRDCAQVTGPPSGTYPAGVCRPWNVAANSDRIVIEIE